MTKSLISAQTFTEHSTKMVNASAEVTVTINVKESHTTNMSDHLFHTGSVSLETELAYMHQAASSATQLQADAFAYNQPMLRKYSA